MATPQFGPFENRPSHLPIFKSCNSTFLAISLFSNFIKIEKYWPWQIPKMAKMLRISIFMEVARQRRLLIKDAYMKRQETVRLSCTTQMGSTWSSMCTMHPFHCPPETLSLREFGGRSQCCFVSLLIHRAIHTSLWTSQTSADHEQGTWSAPGARSLVTWCAHFIVPLFGNAQYGIAYFLSTRNNLYFSKISFSKLIPLIQKILRL